MPQRNNIQLSHIISFALNAEGIKRTTRTHTSCMYNVSMHCSMESLLRFMTRAYINNKNKSLMKKRQQIRKKVEEEKTRRFKDDDNSKWSCEE